MGVNKDIKLIVSDLDGTLLNHDSVLSEANRRAVLELKDRGIAFTFATGRMDKMTWHYAELLELELPIISCNGAMLRNKGEQDWFYRRTIPREAAAAIQAICDPFGADYLFYAVDTVYHVENSKRVGAFVRYNELAQKTGQPLINTVSLDKLPGRLPEEELTKAFVVYPTDRDCEEELAQALASVEGISAVVSMHGSADLMPVGSSKGDAVEKLAESLGIPLSQVMCLGDQANDITMLEKAGLAVGMRSGSAAIRPYCDYFAEHFNCDGLARALRQLIFSE